jgi:hypothetical protein
MSRCRSTIFSCLARSRLAIALHIVLLGGAVLAAIAQFSMTVLRIESVRNAASMCRPVRCKTR